MGQKIIPTSLRLYKNKNWSSNWIVEKKEYPLLLHFDLEIKKYFESIFNHLNSKLIKLNIIKTSKNINIYVYIKNKNPQDFYEYNKIIYHLNNYYQNHYIKIFVQNIKIKHLKKLKKTMRKIFSFAKRVQNINHHFKKIIYNFSYGFYTKNMRIISNTIKESVSKRKGHKKRIKIIYKILDEFYKNLKNFVGYRLQFKGRLTNSKRKRKQIYQKGKIPLNTLNENIQYYFNEVKTSSGLFSIKFWIFFKN